MSTVLWAYRLVDGVAESDEVDRPALCKYTSRLDALCREAGIAEFSSMVDTTDYQFNIDDRELPAGMASTDELMARDGVWLAVSEAVTVMQALVERIEETNVRFGLFSNVRGEVLAELTECVAYAKRPGPGPGSVRFNFALVM